MGMSGYNVPHHLAEQFKQAAQLTCKNQFQVMTFQQLSQMIS